MKYILTFIVFLSIGTAFSHGDLGFVFCKNTKTGEKLAVKAEKEDEYEVIFEQNGKVVLEEDDVSIRTEDEIKNKKEVWDKISFQLKKPTKLQINIREIYEQEFRKGNAVISGPKIGKVKFSTCDAVY